MPQGKGTYGSQVGRPSKKKYNIGGNVSMNADPFSTRNPEGVPAEQIEEAMENQNMANAGLPTSNAQERSQASPIGNEVGTGMYKEGGKVDSVATVAAAKLRKKYKTNPKTGKTDLSKRVGKDSPGYKKGKYWLRNKGKYTDTGSPEHTADLKAMKMKKGGKVDITDVVKDVSDARGGLRKEVEGLQTRKPSRTVKERQEWRKKQAKNRTIYNKKMYEAKEKKKQILKESKK